MKEIKINWPGLVGFTVYVMFLRPQMLKWGTSLGESQRRLDGDDYVPEPNFQATNAINIDAPVEAVWPWLAQMGRERSGYYVYDMINNGGIPSVNFVRQDIEPLQKDMVLDSGLTVLECEENRKLLLGIFNRSVVPGLTVDLTMLYLLERKRDGGTRLLTRQRAFGYGLPGLITGRIYEPIFFFGIMQQLQNLKQFGESMAHLQPAAAQ